MDLRELLAEAVSGVPQAIPGRCVHERVEVGSCQRCVDACPFDAWVLDDAELALDTGRCDGCGLCVAHCPEGALTQPGSSLAAFAMRCALRLSCEQAPNAASDCRLPCINAVSLQQIALLYRSGLRRLDLHTGHCSRCARRDDDGLVSRLASFTRLLDQRGLPGIDVRTGQGHADRPDGSAAEPGAPTVLLNRRGFLRRLVGEVADRQSGADDQAWRAVGEYLPPARRGDLAMHVPQIDSTRCNGCDACARVCPHAALSLSAHGEAYLIRADSCTACGLCADVCDRQAVNVASVATLEQLEVALHRRRCRACGAPFHRPGSSDSGTDLCQVCARVNHRRHLFQVL